MPRKADLKNGYLTKHDGLYRVSMGVPKELRAQLGSRLVRSTGTDSLIEARAIRDMVVPRFKKQIEEAWKARGGKKNSLLAIALETRKAMETADENLFDFLDQGTRDWFDKILRDGARIEDVMTPDGPDERVIPTPEAAATVKELKRVIHRGETPIAYLHDSFMRTLKTSKRSQLDEPRALGILLDWLEAHDIEPFIENVSKPVAVRFMDFMDQRSDLSWASKAKYFGRIKFYWAWLAKRDHAKENPFRDLTLDRPETKRSDDERPYTDEEVQKLLMGKPMEGDRMRDVMLVAALTGARLDAVVDLKVGGLPDHFTFKPQKKERDHRHVPVHPDLLEIVGRRIKNKGREDDLFPEWPASPETSTRPRSAYFSKRYTKYTSDIGVREEEEGRRRSKVNFHSWRRWFITKLERARVREPLIAAIVGHKRPGMTLGLYSGGPEFEEAREAIALVKLPPLDGSPVPEERSLSPRRRA